MKKLIGLFMAARLYLLVLPYALTWPGIALNQAVLAANGGKFPVMVTDRGAKTFEFGEDDMSDDVHCRMTNKTRLNWLADYINFHTVIKSPGDLLIDIGNAIEKSCTVVWAALMVAGVARQRKAKEQCVYCD